MAIKPIRFENDRLLLIDQRLLPHEEVWLELLHFRDRKHMKKVIAKMEKDER